MNLTSSDHVKAEIRRFINESINIDALSDDENLFESGIVNSLFAVQLTTFIESRFGIEVGMDDLEIANFQSVNATADFVARENRRAVKTLLTPAQAERAAEFSAFAAEAVAPFAADWDRAQEIPAAAVRRLGQAGYLGALLPAEFGGRGWDVVTFGLLNEALGRADSAYTGIVTVQAMVAMALLKWGTARQRQEWLAPLGRGEVLGAIALTEPAGGSDLAAMATQFRRSDSGAELILSGEKKWVTSSQTAQIFLVFGMLEGKSVACLVPRGSAGFVIEPIKDLMGFRAAGLARLQFNDVAVPAGNLVGKPGFALSHVAPEGLHYGRISTACSALGLLRGCVEESAGYVTRQIGGRKLAEQGMMQSLIARMGTDLEAAWLLCWSACRAQDEKQPEAYAQAFAAKYFTSRAAVQAASDAVQILGAAGVHEPRGVARFYRDAKIMEIIEGTTQVHERILSEGYVQQAKRRAPASARRPDAA